jgi:hypothetical protein
LKAPLSGGRSAREAEGKTLNGLSSDKLTETDVLGARIEARFSPRFRVKAHSPARTDKSTPLEGDELSRGVLCLVMSSIVYTILISKVIGVAKSVYFPIQQTQRNYNYACYDKWPWAFNYNLVRQQNFQY